MKKNENYSHTQIEAKWQKAWEAQGIYHATRDSKKKKFFGLIEFPYPSGSGLHVGHVRSNTAMDVIARKRRMQGYNVLYPIGWDAFGLPTENYAIKTGIAPAKVTKTNTDIFRTQLKAIGFSFDWSREINTTDPEYFRWTQWIFLQMYKKGLAYKAKTEINWCTSCKIGLANEEVVGGKCERCGGPVEKRQKEQWMLAITKYADRLDRDLDTVDYLEKIKIQQRNWIGKSEGMLFEAPVKDIDMRLQTFSAHFEAFTADTFVVIAPDHPLLLKLVQGVENKQEIIDFAEQIIAKRNVAGGVVDDKEPEGIFTGRYIIDPVGNGELPIWVASYALANYGTGIVKCSAHDERDFAFAKKYGIPLKPVLFPKDELSAQKVRNLEVCYSDMKEGILAAPAPFVGKNGLESRALIIEYLEKNKLAIRKTTYKLRDWVFSRQRYWGEPIPIVYCQSCFDKLSEKEQSQSREGVDYVCIQEKKYAVVPLPEKMLPLELPKVKSYTPTDTGESPLAQISSFVKTTCPKCKSPAVRETDTMPNWAGSSWYFLRYTDPKNKKEFANKENLAYFMKGGVDWYNGGMEHTTLHLLYSRFWHKFLYDLKLVPTSEPYHKRTSHGMILAESGEKMSKSKGNVVNPDEIVATYGADTLRLYEMFMGPFDQSVAWSTASMMGPRKFLERVWRLIKRSIDAPLHTRTKKDLEKLLHKTIKKVADDIENMGFNTAISAMMIFLNEAEKSGPIAHKDAKLFLKILAPFAPHLSEELWDQFGEKNFIHTENWPTYNQKLIVDDRIKIAVQVNGKVRDEIEIATDAEESIVTKQALLSDKVRQFLDGKEIRKVIYVKGRLVSIVV